MLRTLSNFMVCQVVLPPFAHNPTVRRLPDGTGFVIFFIGDGSSAGYPNCTNGTFPENLARRSSAPISGGDIHVIHASSVYGPWSAPLQVMFNDTSGGEWSPGGGTNPAPHIDADGTVTLALQRGFVATPGKELLGVARAPKWNAPYVMITPQPVKPQEWFCVAGTGEDPFLWRSKRGWHLIYHGMCPSGLLEVRHPSPWSPTAGAPVHA